MISRLLLVLFLLFPAKVWADSSALILTGVAGDPEHAEKFTKWTDSTRKTLVEKFDFSPDRVVALVDKKATRDEIRKTFAALKSQLKPLDTFFLFFIGHGSYEGDYKFNISGPDLTGAEYGELLNTLSVGRIVVVNSTSASGGVIDKMMGKNRIVVTATRSGQEGNETVFYEHFLAALEDPASDQDKNGQTSVWEAFKYATAAVERFYKDEGRLATEHAQISDNGADKVGSNVPEPPALARAIGFRVDRQVASGDPKVQALLAEKRGIEQKIEALRLIKDTMLEEQYQKEMEELLVDLALKNQQIRALEKK